MLMRVKSYLKSSVATVAIEFAFIVPVAVLLFSGIFELTNYILLQNKLVRTVGVIGDMITRQDLTRATLTAYLKTATDVLYPFDFLTNGSIIATQIFNNGLTTDTTKMKISWQQNYNGGSSKLGAPGDTPQNIPGNITIIQDQTLIITEVFYNYKPLIFANFLPQKLLYRVIVYVPRSGTMNTLIGES